MHIHFFWNGSTAIKESRTEIFLSLLAVRLCTSIICCPLSLLSFMQGWNEYQMALNMRGNLSLLFSIGYKEYKTAENQTKIKLLFRFLYIFKLNITFWYKKEKVIKIDFKRGKKWRKDHSELKFLFLQSVFLTTNHTFSKRHSD